MSVRRWLVWLLVLTGAHVAYAQSAFCVSYEDKAYVVQKVYRGSAYIQVGKKLKSVKPLRSTLVPVEEFSPLFVSVRRLEVKTYTAELQGGAGNINNQIEIIASFESPYYLPDPFMVLELDMENGGKKLYFHEIGALRPGKPQWVEAGHSLQENLGGGKLVLHIMSEGREVFHSEQPLEYREQMLDKMVLKRIAGAKDAPPQPFVGPMPEYPAALRKSRVKGEALVDIRLTRLGVVAEPQLVRATDPAFGDAAVAAVREWRFLPKVTAGRPVETNVSMPFVFEAPAED